MYTAFYDLKEQPFTLSPSPRFLYLGETHKEAIAALTCGVLEQKGFVLLTGEVGTGKTTIINALIASLDKSVQLVHLSNPLISPKEFLYYFAHKALGSKAPFESKAEFLIAFETFLGDCLHSGKNLLLIIDEAHKLSFELLEEIRVLSDMETVDEKLFNILLVGQPDLNRKLVQPGCRPLLQKIRISYHLRPLDQKGTEEYLITRLQVAGSDDGYKIFPATVIKAIHSYSNGYPRVINTLADNILLLAYSRGKRKITPEMVQECSQSMRLEDTESRQKEERKESDQTTEVSPDTSIRHWKWAALVLAVLLTAYAVHQGRRDLMAPEMELMPSTRQEISEMKSETITLSEARTLEEASPRPSEQIVLSSGKPSPKAFAEQEDYAPVELEQPRIQMANSATMNTSTVVATAPKRAATQSEKLASQREEASFRTITVEQGDSLRELAKDVYGWTSESMFEILREHNPEIDDINMISVGQRVSFPPPSELDRRASSEETIVVRNEILEEPLVSPDEKAFRAYRKALEGVNGKGVLNRFVFESYSHLASVQPSDNPPLLRDSVAWKETWSARRSLIRTIDQSYPRAFSTGKATTLQWELNTILNGLQQGAEEGESTSTYIGRAINLLQGILKKEPTLYEARFNLGVLHHILGKRGKAEAEYRQARKLNPYSSMACLNLGVLYLLEGQVEEAEICFRDLSVLKPAYSGSFYLLGVCQSKRQEDTRAVESLKRAILLEPGFLHSYCELGNVQRKIGLEGEARENFRTVLRHSQASSSVLRKLGYYLLEAGWLSEAVESYSRVLETNDSLSEDWNNRGVAYLRKQEWKRAQKDFLKALEEDPKRPEPHNNLGIVYIQEKEYKRAKDSFLRAERLNSFSHRSILNAAVLYGQYLDDAEMAKKYIRDYIDRGGTFQRTTLQGWLEVTNEAVDASSS